MEFENIEKASRREARRAKTGRLVECHGAAHSNPMIDNCSICAPRWGEIEELAPLDIARAMKEKRDIPFPALSRAQCEEVRYLEASGSVKVLTVRRKNMIYSVARPT